MGTSTTRAIAQEMNAGRVISVARKMVSEISCPGSDRELRPKRSRPEALGFLKPPPTRARHSPQLWPTNASVEASKAWTGTMTSPQRIVLKTPHAVP